MSRDILALMGNHPNRSKTNRQVDANPTPSEILRAREDAGLTQQQAADLLFSSWRTWQDWERGERRMHPASWEAFNIKLRARKLLAAGEISPALLRKLGVYLPPLE